MRKGMLFDESVGEFRMDVEQHRKDMEENLPDNVRMAKVCLTTAMNSINKDLKFTTEAPEDFDNNRLPTLDFMIWMVDGMIYHTYFEKPMKK